MEAGLRWINADRKSRACHVEQVIGRCVNFARLHPSELVWLSTAESYILDDQIIRDAIYKANWFVRRRKPTICLVLVNLPPRRRLNLRLGRVDLFTCLSVGWLTKSCTDFDEIIIDRLSNEQLLRVIWIIIRIWVRKSPELWPIGTICLKKLLSYFD